MSLRK